jgi:hypothetical protein
MFVGFHIFAQDQEFEKANLWNTGDTLVNFNKLHNNNVKSIELSSMESLPSFLSVSQEGYLIFTKDINELENKFSFELKTITLDGEVYINMVSFEKLNNQIPILTVSSDKIDMAKGWRADGKIYVVVGVSLVLFLFLAIYLAIIDRKVIKFEKEAK